MLKITLRFFAIALIAVFIVAFPVSLVVRNIGKVAFDREMAKTLVHESVRGSSWVNTLAFQAPRQLLGNEQENGSAVAKVALSNLSDEDWNEISKLVVPDYLLDDTINPVVDAFLSWLEKDSPFPDVQIEVSALKTQALAKSSEILSVIIKSLPPCDQSSSSSLTQAGQSDSASIPVCLPPEPALSQLKLRSEGIMKAFLASAPDSIDLLSLDNGSALQDLSHLKSELVRLRTILLWTWFGVLCAGLLAAALASATGRSFFRWIGWPLVVSGVLMLVFAVGQYLFSLNFINVFLASVLEQTTGPSDTLGNAFASGVLTLTRNAVLLQGLIAVLLGSASIVYARVRERTVLSPGIPIRRWKIGL